MKLYQGRVPACGVFCGGCPIYTREKNPCLGADINSKKCDNCKSFHLCCKDRGINHCYECSTFPCYRFRRFTKSWLKFGQDLTENQKLLEKKERRILLFILILLLKNKEGGYPFR